MLTLQPVALPVGGVRLAAELAGPAAAAGVVVIARGTGSCRHDPGHRAVAERLHRAALGTLLVDLLTDAEERAASAAGTAPDSELMTARLAGVVAWTARQPLAGGRPLGLLGSAAAAAAALQTAQRSPDVVRAVAVAPRGHRVPGLRDPGEPAVPVLVLLGEQDDRPATGPGLEVVDLAAAGVRGGDALADAVARWFPTALGA